MPASNRSVAQFCGHGEFVAAGSRRPRLKRKKKSPGNPGLQVWEETLKEAACGDAEVDNSGNLDPYSPKWGRSPLRSDIRAEAISARSIAAIRRIKRGVFGAIPIAAVLAMWVPFPQAAIK